MKDVMQLNERELQEAVVEFLEKRGFKAFWAKVILFSRPHEGSPCVFATVEDASPVRPQTTGAVADDILGSRDGGAMDRREALSEGVTDGRPGRSREGRR
ncbi:MAG: hypothetical protein KAJ19_21415 [Gammaproteobacteria bacterium]|nr:hypothetical protein [Gammaproteobacteria bacterium]